MRMVPLGSTSNCTFCEPEVACTLPLDSAAQPRQHTRPSLAARYDSSQHDTMHSGPWDNAQACSVGLHVLHFDEFANPVLHGAVASRRRVAQGLVAKVDATLEARLQRHNGGEAVRESALAIGDAIKRRAHAILERAVPCETQLAGVQLSGPFVTHPESVCQSIALSAWRGWGECFNARWRSSR
jgi:hypothetical protein